MKRIVCTGPESSGTRLLSRIVASGGVETVHRSMPHGPDWSLGLVPGDVVVLILRNKHSTVASAVAAGRAVDVADAVSRRRRAWLEIRRQCAAAAVPALDVKYERIVRLGQRAVDEIGGWLGVQLSVPEELRDENAKWGDEL